MLFYKKLVSWVQLSSQKVQVLSGVRMWRRPDPQWPPASILYAWTLLTPLWFQSVIMYNLYWLLGGLESNLLSTNRSVQGFMPCNSVCLWPHLTLRSSRGAAYGRDAGVWSKGLFFDGFNFLNKVSSKVIDGEGGTGGWERRRRCGIFV